MGYLKNGSVNRIKDIIEHMDKCYKGARRCEEHLTANFRKDDACKRWSRATRAKLAKIVSDFEANGYDSYEEPKNKEPKNFKERLNNNANDFDSIIVDMLKHIDKLEEKNENSDICI
jgi:hypothetical protein